MTSIELNPRRRLAILAIALGGVMLRLTGLGRGFWFDELATMDHVDAPNLWAVLKVAAGDNQPPLYNGSIYFWIKAFGPTEVAVRSLSLLLGLLALLTPWLARAALNRSEKWLSFAVLCVMSLPIRYAQEARNYSLLLLLSSACLFSYYELLKNPADRRTRSVFFAALVLLDITHIFGMLLSLSFVAVMFWTGRSLARRLLIAVFGAALAALVVVPLYLGGVGQYAGGNFWITFTLSSLMGQLLTVFTPAGILLLAFAWLQWPRGDRRIGFDPRLVQALLPFVLTFVGALIISLNTPILTDRNLIVLIPAYALVVARLLQRSLFGARSVLALTLLALILGQSAFLVVDHRMFIREDFRGIARRAVAQNTSVCYLVARGRTALWQPVMAFYVDKIYHRSDLRSKTFAPADLPSDPASVDCGLWADAHPDGPTEALTSLPQFAGCTRVPLGEPEERIVSVLLTCRR